MPNLTPPQHAQFGCHYLTRLVQHLESHRWCFGDTYELETKVNNHATALGLAPPSSFLIRSYRSVMARAFMELRTACSMPGA